MTVLSPLRIRGFGKSRTDRGFGLAGVLRWMCLNGLGSLQKPLPRLPLQSGITNPIDSTGQGSNMGIRQCGRNIRFARCLRIDSWNLEALACQQLDGFSLYPTRLVQTPDFGPFFCQNIITPWPDMMCRCSSKIARLFEDGVVESFWLSLSTVVQYRSHGEAHLGCAWLAMSVSAR